MIFLEELLKQHQVRRTKKQKDAFLKYAQKTCQGLGYESRIEPHEGRAKGRNLIVGDAEKAKMIFTAHYDTCAQMPLPNLIFPQNMPLTLLVQMPMVLAMVGLALGAGLLLWHWTGERRFYMAGFLLVYWALFLLMFFGPANPHTANDNTSGVAALFRIMEMLPEEKRRDVAFIFFDQEEMGKVGSKQYAKKHPDIQQNKPLLNLDCIGDGPYFLIVAPKEADKKMKKEMQRAFQDQGAHRAIHCSAKKTHYNSDQLAFKQGWAIAACQKNKLGYHVSRIHTRRDVICEESNLEYVCQGAVKLTDAL